MKRLLSTTAIAMMIGIFALLYGTFYEFPWEQVTPNVVTLEVPKGSSLQTVGRLLQQRQVVPSARRFVWLGKILRKSAAMQSGEYEFQLPIHPLEVLRIVSSGHVKLYPLTIPEGFNVEQIAGLLAGLGLADEEEFLKLAKSGDGLEGYLFPTTYTFKKGMSAAEIQATMVREFHKALPIDFDQQLAARHMTERQAITLASIIEKETGVAEERPRIAAVYLNRLKKGMRLQADPTVIYGIPNFDGNLRRVDLETWSPYNTYRIKGLPPGPIANPGRAAILAVLNPDHSDYLFFVANGAGTHLFSRTYEEHAKLVARYQTKRGSQTNRSVKPPRS